MRSGGSISIGSLGSFGRSSCASKEVAQTNTNAIARRPNIALDYATQPSPTEAERRARESSLRSDSSAMAVNDRDDEKDATAEKAQEPHALISRFRRPAKIKSITLTGLFILAVFYTMYFMRSMLLPLVLALLLSYLLVPLVRGLGHLRIRPVFGAAIVLIALIGGISY